MDLHLLIADAAVPSQQTSQSMPDQKQRCLDVCRKVDEACVSLELTDNKCCPQC